MKKIFLLLSLSMIGLLAHAQETKPAASPAAKASATIKGKTVTVEYSQPSVKGREIWGKLVPYGQVWRTGANASTSIEFSAWHFVLLFECGGSEDEEELICFFRNS